MNILKKSLQELRHHYLFTATATILAIIIVLLIKKTTFEVEPLFNIFHPLHVFASAIVSSAIFYKCKPKIFQAILVGVGSSIIVGSLSDIILPYMGAFTFLLKPEFHLPIIENPPLILGTAIIGSLIGIVFKFTRFPHFVHVFLSVFASLFYLIAFTGAISTIHILLSFIIVFIAVIIPCCISDIFLPVFFLGEHVKHCGCETCGHIHH